MNHELLLFFRSFWIGAVLLAVYDILRSLRQVIPHKQVLLAIEDLCFWISCGLFVFSCMYRENNGIIRSYAILGILLGMLAYHWSLSDFVVKVLVKLLNIPVKIALFLIKRLIFVIRRCRILLHRKWGGILKKREENSRKQGKSESRKRVIKSEEAKRQKAGRQKKSKQQAAEEEPDRYGSD